jgi:hypothetical protein
MKLELLCKGYNDLFNDADTLCWRPHTLALTYSYRIYFKNGKIDLIDYIEFMKERCLNKEYWDDINSWKQAYFRHKALHDNWSAGSSSQPKTRTSIIGFKREDPSQSALPIPKLRSLTSSRQLQVPYASQESSYVWRARLDTARDANFLLTTWHTGGVRVVDASPTGQGDILWELPRWSVRPYAHLEYKKGVACWDGENGVEVWKRWKIMFGEEGEDEPASKRGQFVKVATLPDLANTRGFMLNDDLHLTICSSDGTSMTYDLAPLRVPQLLYSYQITTTPNNGPAGHLEHDSDIAVYSMGQKGYTIYQKVTSTHLGDVDFSLQTSTLYTTLDDSTQTNFFSIDPQNRYPALAETGEDGKRKEFVTVRLEQGGLGERGGIGQQANQVEAHDMFLRAMNGEKLTRRTNGIPLQYDMWGAAMIRKLDDGATILVARSRGGRLLVCTDLLGLLEALQDDNEEVARIKIRQTTSMIECGGRATRTEVSYIL